MEFVRLFKEIAMVLLICKTSWSTEVDPKYTKFMYEEQLLEKMVRLELFVENVGNNTRKFMSDSTAVLREIQNSSRIELKEMTERMNRLESRAQSFHKNVTSALNKSFQANTEWIGNTTSAFEEEMLHANSLTNEILRNFQAFKSDLMSLYEKDRRDMMAWRNATGSLEVPNRMADVISSLDNVQLLHMNDCYDIKKELPNSPSGVYYVSLWKTKQQVKLLCDMDTDGGGWTIFQKRFNGSVDFYRTFKEYEDGFGQIGGEFWLGLKTVQEIAARGKSELRLDLTAADDSHVYEVFQNFKLSSGPKYRLRIDGGTGTAGDSQGLSYSNKRQFYTRDNDNSYNCADLDHGGWWYYNCAHANLNGDYVTPGTKFRARPERGVIYRSFKSEESLKSTVMMVRRV